MSVLVRPAFYVEMEDWSVAVDVTPQGRVALPDVDSGAALRNMSPDEAEALATALRACAEAARALGVG